MVVAVLECMHMKKNDTMTNSCVQNTLKLKKIMNMVGIAVHRLYLERHLKQQKEHNIALLKMARAVAVTSDIEGVIQRVRKTVFEYVRCDKIAIFIVDELRQELWCKSSDDLEGFRLPLSAGVVGYVATTGKQLNVEDAYKVNI